jgi:hypothetical protein
MQGPAYVLSIRLVGGIAMLMSSRWQVQQDLFRVFECYSVTAALAISDGLVHQHQHRRETNVTGVFCTSGSEREFTLEGSWYADEEIQAGADRDASAGGWHTLPHSPSERLGIF